MASTLERARRLADDIGATTSPEGFADVAVDGLWSLIPAYEVTCQEIDVAARRILVERTRSIDAAQVPSYQAPTPPERSDKTAKLLFASAPSIRRAMIVARTNRDFTDLECDLLVLLAPHLETGYRRARAFALLTPRELDVLGLVRDGLTNREIARRLDIGPGTVRSHLEHAFGKLDVGTRTAAVATLP
jgi:DNA-binding CsgD family transcriptional regulator